MKLEPTIPAHTNTSPRDQPAVSYHALRLPKRVDRLKVTPQSRPKTCHEEVMSQKANSTLRT